MNLDELISELESVREEHGGDLNVTLMYGPEISVTVSERYNHVQLD